MADYKGGKRSTEQEYKTVRIPFFGGPSNRDNLAYSLNPNKDQEYINVSFESYKNPGSPETKYYARPRPGYTLVNRPPGANATARGLYVWNNNNAIYSVFGDKIYKGTTDLGVTLTTTTGLCGFSETRPGAANQSVAINDGARLYLINAADAVTTVTTNFPTPNTGDLHYLNGYFFVMKTDGTVWNCSVDDPTSWSLTTFLTAQMENGNGVALARQKNMLVALGSNYLQMFFDAAIPAPGSPLQNAEQLFQGIGCLSRETVASQDNKIIWVSRAQSGGIEVLMLEDLSKITKISTTFIERSISFATGLRGFLLSIQGKSWYVLDVDNFPAAGVGDDRTFAYDLDLGVWSTWGTGGGKSGWKIYYSTANRLGLLSSSATGLSQGISDGNIYSVGFGVTDNGASFDAEIRFNKLDLNSTKRKFYHSAEIVGDNSTYPAQVRLSYSDDDYQTQATQRVMDGTAARAVVYRLGQSRRRSWIVTIPSASSSSFFRLEALELRYSEEER
jgi:hypothetical protein